MPVREFQAGATWQQSRNHLNEIVAKLNEVDTIRGDGLIDVGKGRNGTTLSLALRKVLSLVPRPTPPPCYYTLSRLWEPLTDTAPDPLDWQSCGQDTPGGPSPTNVGVDVPYAGYVRAISATLGGNVYTGPWDIRVYNATTATATGSPEITNLAAEASDSAVGGVLPCAVHDKLFIQIRGPAAAGSMVGSFPVDIVLERS